MNVTIEASIGVGKSTLLRNLKEIFENGSELSTSIFPEPTERWEKNEEGNLLLLFSKNKGRYALATQTHIMTTLHQQRINPPNTDIRIYERSLLSAKYVFQAGLAEQGYLDKMECLILDNLQEVLTKNMPITDRIIYLRANPNVAYERANARNGDSDRFLPIEYFQLIHKMHEQLIQTLVDSGKDVHVIDADEKEMDIAIKAVEWIKKEEKVLKAVKNEESNNEMLKGNKQKINSTESHREGGKE